MKDALASIGCSRVDPLPRLLHSSFAIAALELRHTMQNEGRLAAERGLEQFYHSSFEEAVFERQGGDILFLMRNLAVCGVPPLRAKARECFIKVVDTHFYEVLNTL